MNEGVTVQLTADEAHVLFDWLQRFSNTGKLDFEDKAEQIALWNLTCLLEKKMATPFTTDFPAFLQAARERLRGEDDAS
jgi:hypothetical protein